MLATDSARIGPNSLIQTAGALVERYGRERAAALVGRSARPDLLDDPPHEMVDEQEFIDLEHLLLDAIGPEETRAVLRRAGERTADYLLHHRIPRPARLLLPLLPPTLGLTILLRAVGRHAWTFVGSGQFSYVVPGRRPGALATIAVEGCPICREVRSAEPFCVFYGGTFTALFGRLIRPGVTVTEIACAASGAPRCVFEVAAPREAGPSAH